MIKVFDCMAPNSVHLSITAIQSLAPSAAEPLYVLIADRRHENPDQSK